MLTRKLEASQAEIRERWYPHFAWLLHDSTPWTELTRPLAAATIALVSTCGLYELDSQLPFDAWHDLGDPSYREIHLDTPPDRLRIAHSHYNHEYLGRDTSVALPFAHFERLQAAGLVGRLHPVAYSFMGYLPEPRQLMRESAPQVARRLVAAGVHAAFLTPC